VEQTWSPFDCDALAESYLGHAYGSVNIDGNAGERMRAIGISVGMVAEALNAPHCVRHLPQSSNVSYFCKFNGRTLRVMTTLEDCVLSVSWTTSLPITQ
jgi:hypothetical protein